MPDEIQTVSDFKQFVDGYDGAIRFMDEHIGQILELLRRKGVYDETLIIISGDHGEAMGEFGVYGDHVCAAEPVNRIPMILRGPGIPRDDAPRRDLIYNVDLPPTLCEWLGIPIPKGWDGKSFAGLVRGNEVAWRDHLVWGHGLYSVQRVVRTARWNFLRTYHPGLYAFEPRALYDMDTDPHQTRNVIHAHPRVASQLEAHLEDWKRELLDERQGPDPFDATLAEGPWNYVELEYWLDRLRSHGRNEQAAAIRSRLDQWTG
jgi:arylsulfatase A-like enzyme